MKCSFDAFWSHHPALLYGVAILLGSWAALYSFWPPLFIFSFVVLSLRCSLRLFLALSLGLTCFGFCYSRYQFPKEIPHKAGMAEVEITAVSSSKTPFGRVWNYKGTINSFLDQSGLLIAREVPFRATLPFEKYKDRPLAAMKYRFRARLKETGGNGKYALVPVKGESWTPIQKLSSLAEWRFAAKSLVQQHIQQAIKDPQVGAFLSGLATGEFDDRLLSFELGRFGLQHLMAVSGMHFSVLSAFLSFLFNLFFSRRAAVICVITLMTTYFLFLGDSPSVMRAWIAISLTLGSLFVGRRSTALNSLGIGIVAVVLCDPLRLQDIGFQFSFGVTASILLWFSPCDAWMQKIFAKRTLAQVTQMDWQDQHGYCFLHFLRQGLALCIAVNLVALPLTLYHFHKFPLAGLLYNLFFPFMASLSMFLLVFSCGFSLVFPWLSSQLHSWNESYTQALLNAVFHLPKSFDWMWRVTDVPLEMLTLYLVAVFGAGIFFRMKEQNLNPT